MKDNHEYWLNYDYEYLLNYVHKNKYHRWDVRVWMNNKLYYLGLYETKEAAVKIAKKTERKFNGKAQINYVNPVG